MASIKILTIPKAVFTNTGVLGNFIAMPINAQIITKPKAVSHHGKIKQSATAVATTNNTLAQWAKILLRDF